ncbi:hypothetical protein JCM19239_2732 [Vibrio variabilis]|uniref:Uncharacterized protein n=1 Tax=Vibrio variabilis TaxID=990271 RepID=A0ABQ0JQN7_9VIBR|nr:hypothetical protein JCM19239_2732 [Vibrio variabilis]
MAKAWYKRQLETGNWGREANLLYKAFLPTIQEEVDLFLTEFNKAYTQIQSDK